MVAGNGDLFFSNSINISNCMVERNFMTKHILVIGAGSIGKRHARNFSSLGCTISILDTREDRKEEARNLENEGVDIASVSTDIEVVLKRFNFDGILICTPPHIHAQQIIDICKTTNIPIFSEKPLTTTLEDALKVQEAVERGSNPFMLGYCWRAAEAIKKLGVLIKEGKIGKPLHANFTMAAYLPDWHPWEDYRDFFVSKRSWGGGALYENHWLDLMLWWWGMPNELVAICDKISGLDLEEGTDDNVDVIFSYDSGLRCTLHLDLYSRPHNKSIEIVGEKGTLSWDFRLNCIRYRINEDPAKFEKLWDFSHTKRNDMFLAEAQGFLCMIDGKTEPTCGLEDGINVLKVIEWIRASAEMGIKIVPKS